MRELDKCVHACTIFRLESLQAVTTEIIWDQIHPNEDFVATRGLDECLFIFSQEGWQEFEELIETLPMDCSEKRMWRRYYLVGAIDFEITYDNRIYLPSFLLDRVHIENEAIIEGNGGFAIVYSPHNRGKIRKYPNGIADLEKRFRVNR